MNMCCAHMRRTTRAPYSIYTTHGAARTHTSFFSFFISRRGINKLQITNCLTQFFDVFKPETKKKKLFTRTMALPRQTNIRIGIENSVRHTYSHTWLRLHGPDGSARRNECCR